MAVAVSFRMSAMLLFLWLRSKESNKEAKRGKLLTHLLIQCLKKSKTKCFNTILCTPKQKMQILPSM